MFGAGMAREKRISPNIKLSIRVRQGSDGYMVAECPDIPGAISQGKTREEALTNLEDVVRTCLALIVRKWLGNAKSGSAPADQQPIEEQQMILTFVRGQVA